MNIFDEFTTVVRELNAFNVRHMLVGGVAMAFHVEPRFTQDIDFMIHPDDLEKCTQALAKAGYQQMGPPMHFQSNQMSLHRFLRFEGEEHGVVDVLLANAPHHQAMLERAHEAQHEGMTFRIIQIDDLIPLKAERNSDQDRVDIRRLRNE